MENMKKLFYRYLTIYAGLLVILILGSFFMTQMAKKLIWENLIEEERLNLEKGALRFEQSISAMQSFSDHLSTLDSINVLRKEKGILKVSNYIEMNKAKSQLAAFTIVGDLPYNFVLFQDNEVFLSKKDVSDNYEEYYNFFLGADLLSAKEFKELVFGLPDTVSFITFDSFQYFDGRNVILEAPLLVVVKPTLGSGKRAEDFCCIFVMSKEAVLNYFFTDANADNTIFYVNNDSGKTLIQQGSEFIEETLSDITDIKTLQDTWRLLHIRTEEVALDFYVGIAYSKVEKQVDQLSYGISVLLIISVIYTIFAIFLLAWNRYKPTKLMLESLSDISEKKIVASDEFEYVEKVANAMVQVQTNLKKQFEDLKIEMDSVILSKVLTQGIISEKDKDSLKKILPQHLDYYYVIIFCAEKVGTGSLYEVSQCVINSFGDCYGDYLYALCGEISETVFLVEQKETEIIDFEKMEIRLRTVVRQVSKKMNITCSVGVSGIASDIKSLNNAYEQAKQAYLYTKREYENTVGYYFKIKQEIGNEFIEMNSLLRIYDMILAGNKNAIERNLCQIVNVCEKRADSQLNREIFYSISCIIHAAYEKLGFQKKDMQNFRWDGANTFGSQIENMKKEIFLLIEKYDKNKKSHNTGLMNDIIRYIDENYMNAGLTVLEVCEAVHISEKYLTQFLKEQTRKSFSKCLEEVRINKAKEYLLYTDYSNVIIAEKVGFGSVNTFYRVFNKVERVSPSNWKKENRR